MFLVFLHILLFMRFSNAINCDLEPKNAEGRLKKQLLCTYNPNEMPNAGKNKITEISIGIWPFVYDLSDYSSKINLETATILSWQDDRLKWDSDKYSDIKTLAIGSEEIWVPNVKDFSADPHTDAYGSLSNCDLNSNGSIDCTFIGTYDAPCKTDLTDWPFDTAACKLQLNLSEVYSGQMVLKSEPVDDISPVQSADWDLISMDGSCCPPIYNFLLQRNFVAEMALLITPTIIFACINIMIPLLDPRCVLRIILIAASFFAHFELQSFIDVRHFRLRPGDNLPKIATFYRDSLIISGYLILHTAALRSIASMSKEPHKLIKTITMTLNTNKISARIFSRNYIIRRGPNFKRADMMDDAVFSTNVKIDTNLTKNNENADWMDFAKFLDILLFLILLIAYLSFLIALIPHKVYDRKITYIKEFDDY